MKQTHETIPLPNDTYVKRYFSESCAFFDIETTGFSPKNAFVYLIGLAVREKNTIHIYQFLAKNRKEEPEILSAFHKRLGAAKTLLSFNGIGFDLPFLKGREAFHQIAGNWDSYAYTDLYKLMGKFARLFHLPDKKQKSFERFLGIDRDDLLSGGELIPVYYAYEAHADSHAEQLLLLHNFEDVLGMTKLLPLLSYADFFALPKNVLTASYAPSKEEKELLLTLKAPVPFPKQFLYQTALCSLSCQDASAKLLVKAFRGELKYYYDNYKDYYYLPEEDMAIHKSVAAFVDSGHRKKATAATCYTKKSGVFLPQKNAEFTPEFHLEKKSPISYFELTNDFLSDSAAQNAYASHLLEALLNGAVS